MTTKPPSQPGMRLPSSADADEGALTIIFAGGRATAKYLRKSQLVVIEGPDEGLEVKIDQMRMTGGRSIINNLVLSDKAVSGTHFEIESTDKGYCLRDMGSTNGTFAGGLRIKEVYLKPGATFQVGHSVIRFQPTNEVVAIELSSTDRFGKALGRSVAMREVFAILEKVAPSDLTLLISGETGTGKEVIARAIHDKSRRKDGPFVVLDCGAIPKNLIESTLFGHEKGAFTGAVERTSGAFEQANGGTIFLDEIGELDIELQPKLLRVLENREIKRVGGTKTLPIDVRVLAATNRDLRKMVSDGSFREDLYFRLSVMHVELPLLRHRRGDIDLLAKQFLDNLSKRRGVQRAFSHEAIKALENHDWPGNVRELRNVVERAASLSDGPIIGPSDLLWDRPGTRSRHATSSGSSPLGQFDPATMSQGMAFKQAKQQVIDAFEEAYLTALIKAHTGNITRAAEQAGLTRYHMRELLKKYGLKA